MRLLIMGPPGAGKGTQATAVADRYQIPAISTGDIFRANVAQQTALGLEVDRIMKSGGYVSDELTNQIVADRLAEEDARSGFLLDGYPRTLAQVAALDELLAAQGHQLDAVICLDADADELVTRLLRRAEAEGRADDNEETIRVRQQKYAEETAPLLEVFADRGLLVRVDGLGEVDEVRERIAAAVDARG